MAGKQYVVIGLGKFGTSVAKTLYETGNDVLAIDKNEELVQEIADHVTHAIQLEATDENALKTIGITNFDVAIITIGSDIQSSVMATLLVKEVGVKYIVAKAHSDLHAKVLQKIGADRVIQPEKDMGARVAHNLVAINILDYIELSPDYSVIEIESPKVWHGKTLRELNVRAKYGINIMAVKGANDINIAPNAEDVISEDDIILAIGSTYDLAKLETIMSK